MSEISKLIYDKINDNAVKYDKTQGIISIFKQICKKSSNVIAIRYKNISYTYEELDILTDTIAWNILNTGIAEKSTIGIYMDKDERYVISILSILKCNCIYVPISKMYPNDRVASMLECSKTKAVIVDSECNWIGQRGIEILNYDDMLVSEKEKFVYNDMKAELKAYILFTSGSTGIPKGILIRQHSIVNLINSMAEELIEENNKVKVIGVLSQFVFDVSVAQMYLALLTGNTLEVICDDVRFEPEKLMYFFKDVHMDICEFTPMYLDMLVKYCEINNKELFIPKYVLNVGEALPYSLAKRILILKNIEIFNYYGPTEICVYSTYFRVNGGNIDKLDNILVGKPIHNVQTHIFDNDMKLCDIGEEGELYISGDGVADGYVNDEEQTKRVFTKNVFNENIAMYKTGDLVRITKSGDIQYIGRMDDQIKVRGFRIELKEIEVNIKNIKKIKDARVFSCDEGINKVIIAYFISDETLTTEYFINELSKCLPYYMIPTYYVPVEKFEKNINGKLDKKKLPDYKKHCVCGKDDNEHNYSDIEYGMLEICRELLEYKNLRIDDNFYNYGGNSLTFMELNSIINQKWNVNFAISDLYKCKTIKDIADLLNVYIGKNKTVHNMLCTNTEKKLVISEFQKRIINLEKKGTTDMSESNIFHVIYFDKYIDSNHLSKALDKLVEHQNILQSKFYMENGVLMMSIADKCEGYFEKINTEESLDSENLIKYGKKLDIENNPNFKLILLENKKNEQVMLLNIHHAVFDLMSFDIFINQLIEYYNGKKIKKLEYDFFDYMNYINQKDKTEIKSFWKKYLLGRQKAVCFNIENKNARIRHRDMFEKSCFKIEGELLQKLRKCCREWQTTEYILLISAFSILLSKNTSCKDITIGTYIPGRDNTDNIPANDIIGLFTKMFPFRFIINKELRFIEFVKIQKENFSKLLEYQESTQEEIYGALEFDELVKGQLFHLVFNYIFEYERQIENFKIRSTEIGSEPKVFPYYVTAIDKKDCIIINTTYIKRCYSEDDIKIIENEYKKMINEILYNESSIISEI